MIHNGISAKRLTTPLCIIGTGIGGGTLAKKLSEAGKEFILIEAGEFSGNSGNVNYSSVGRDFGLRSTSSIQIGGTSNLWHGVLAQLDAIDFIARDWIPFSGWPITYDDIKPFYNIAAELLGVEKPNYFCPTNLDSAVVDQLAEVKFNDNYLNHKVFQQPTKPLNFKDVVREICEGSTLQNLYYNSTALELISVDDKITALKIGNLDGSFSTVEADVFIVAAGALETPRLLLNSKFKNNNIGRFLMDHPMGNLCQMEFLIPKKAPIYSDTKSSKNMKIKVGFELTEEKQESLRLPNHCFFLRPSFVKGIDNESEKIKMSLLSFKDGSIGIQDILKLAKNPNAVRQILTYKFSLDVMLKYVDLFFVTEQTPNFSSQVRLSTIKDHWGYPISEVDWKVSASDIASIKDCFKLLLDDFFLSSDVKFTHSLDDFNWEENFTSAVHHVGTARMSDREELGVVDKNLNVFGKSNLYVCDGSVFTTAGNVNNGLTISALAVRLAKYLENI